MRAIVDLILLVLELFQWVIIIVAVMSWLIAFDVLNIRQNFVRTIWNALNALTEPFLRPIRNIMPNLGGLDISPVILLLIIYFLQRVILYYIYPRVLGF